MQSDPVDEEKDTGDLSRFKEPLDEGRSGAGLAGAGRHLDEELTPASADLLAERVDAPDLIVAAGNRSVDLDDERVPAHLPNRGPTFQILL